MLLLHLLGIMREGAAYAALSCISCTIIMPQNVSPAKVAATKAYGARVVYGD